MVRQRAEGGFLPQPQRGLLAPNPHSLGGVGAGESPMSDCRRRALLGFCKVRVSRHKARGVAEGVPHKFALRIANLWGPRSYAEGLKLILHLSHFILHPSV